MIPAAGLGTRFLPATKAQPKEMLPVVDKPSIQYVVEEAVRAGLDDILIVTGRNKASIENHFDRAVELEADLESKSKFDLLEEVRSITDMANLHYVRQGEARGLGHAVSMARRHVGDEPFAVLLPDDLIHPRMPLLDDMLRAFAEVERPVVGLLEVEPDEISAYGCAVVEPVDAQLVRVMSMVEKPEPSEALSNLAVIGRYVLTPDVFDAIENLEPGAGGELQLTDAIAALAAGAGVFGWTFRGGRFDTGNKIDYLRAVVELALERPDLGPPLRAFIDEVSRRP